MNKAYLLPAILLLASAATFMLQYVKTRRRMALLTSLIFLVAASAFGYRAFMDPSPQVNLKNVGKLPLVFHFEGKDSPLEPAGEIDFVCSSGDSISISKVATEGQGETRSFQVPRAGWGQILRAEASADESGLVDVKFIDAPRN